MNYCITEKQLDENFKFNAGVKARDDITRILCHMGMKRISLTEIQRDDPNPVTKVMNHVKIAARWRRAFAELTEGDVLYVQFPPILHTVFYVNCINSLKKRGVRVILLIHDLEILRWKKKKNIKPAEKIRFDIEEISVLRAADGIIAHNEKMKQLLTDLGISQDKIVSLGIFDYLIPGYSRKEKTKPMGNLSGPVIIAGNLARHKAGYVYNLPDDIRFELFGTRYDGEDRDNITYRGQVDPGELPFLLDGSFGLVWDGESTDTCSGVYGEYLAYNNPHKTSLYLASGMPVIIWENAALADFVKENRCGITVSSLSEIGSRLAAMTEEEYRELRDGAMRVGSRLRRGDMIQNAISAL